MHLDAKGSINMLKLVRTTIATAILGTTIAIAGAVVAEGFSVSPTSLTVPAGGQQTTLTVESSGAGETLGQVRVMRWLRDGGQNKLIPTRDVVASPPALRMRENQEITIRLIRTATTPVTGQECYRVLVDQLPGPRERDDGVRFMLRHSIPLCFLS
jgi:fimbrial chaperone protein